MDPVELQARLIELLHQARAEQQAMIDSLTPRQRAAVGTPEHWSAKDVVLHVASWWRAQTDLLRALREGKPAPALDDAEIDHRNAQTLARGATHSWEQANAEAQDAHDAQVATLQLIEAERFVTDRIGERPLWRAVLSNGFLHPQLHLTEFYRGQRDAERASQVQERSAEILLRELPIPQVQGIALYNIACVYATSGRPTEAIARLRAALPLDPELVERSQHDADLDSLRELPAFQRLYASSRTSRKAPGSG